MLPAKQFLIFCVVGVITTVVDFGIFNLLTRPAVGWRRIPANIVSVAIAMTWSFLANWFIVFHADGHDWLGRAGRFLATTAFSAFVLQNVILYFTTYVWKEPVNVALFIVRKVRLNHRLNDDIDLSEHLQSAGSFRRADLELLLVQVFRLRDLTFLAGSKKNSSRKQQDEV